MIGFAKEFVLGFTTPLKGLVMIAESRRVRRLALIPFALTLLIFIVGLATGLPFITGLVTPFSDKTIEILCNLFGSKPTSDFMLGLSMVLPILIWPALALALFYLLIVATRLFVSPFYGLLSERVLIERGKIEAVKFHLFPWMTTTIRMTGASIVKAIVFSILGLILMILSFIPGLGIFTGFGLLVLIAYDVTDYALEVLEWGFARRLAFFRIHFPAFIGLGCALGLVFLIPGLNFFLLPASVTGAAELVRRLDL